MFGGSGGWGWGSLYPASLNGDSISTNKDHNTLLENGTWRLGVFKKFKYLFSDSNLQIQLTMCKHIII